MTLAVVATPRNELADSCRYAALAFLNGVLAEWGKRELAAWLSGPYNDVVAHARDRISLKNMVVPPRQIAPYAISRVMREAHDEVLTTLRMLAAPDGGVSFGFDVMDVLVVQTNAVGIASFVPTATPRMRLAERVLSLIAADYLSRPEDYEERLAICTRCTLISFDAAARARGVCRVHAASGIRFRNSEPPVTPKT